MVPRGSFSITAERSAFMNASLSSIFPCTASSARSSIRPEAYAPTV